MAYCLRPGSRSLFTLVASLITVAFAGPEQAPYSATNAIIPRSLVSARVWLGSSHDSSLAFPELSAGDYGIPALQQKPNVGVACSGGGHRAALLCQGTMRALHQLGLLPKLRYLSSNSGGSWFSSAFSYQNQSSLDVFLGPYLTPDRLTLSRLDLAGDAKGSFSSAIVTTTLMAEWAFSIYLNVLNLLPRVGGWSAAVGKTLQAPFGLTSLKSTITAAGTRGGIDKNVRAQAAALGAGVYTAQPDMPFPIFVFSSIQADTKTVFFPAEFTPLYIGVPTVINNSLASEPLGGYVIEPLGFNGGLAQNTTFGLAGTDQTVLINSTYIVPLAGAAGTSGAYPAEALHLSNPLYQGLLGLPLYDYWTPAAETQESKYLLWGDGGGHDNSALYPLLRRKVPKIIVALATTFPVTPGTMDLWSSNEDMVARAFGCFPIDKYAAPDGINATVINTAFKVFNETGYIKFWNAVSGKLAAGKPNFFRATYKVLANEVMGVPGGWSVDILWVLNQQVDSWEAKLPAATFTAINDSRTVGQGRQFTLDSLDTTDFQTFPLDGGVHGGLLDYTSRGASALTQLRTWVMLQAKDALLDMFGVKKV